MLDPVIAEFIKMDQKNIHRNYDWTQEFVLPVPVKVSFRDRILSTVGDLLVSTGNRLKQRYTATLNADQAQAPTFMIML